MKLTPSEHVHEFLWKNGEKPIFYLVRWRKDFFAGDEELGVSFCLVEDNKPRARIRHPSAICLLSCVVEVCLQRLEDQHGSQSL